MRSALRAVASLRLTIALMLALGALLLAGLWIPQKAVLQRELYLEWKASAPTLVRVLEAAGLTDIHRSPLAIGIWVAFFVNLLAAVALRAPGIVRRAALTDCVPSPGELGGPHRGTIAATGPDALGTARAFFAARGFAIRDGEGRFRAVRHRLSPLATLLFHLSFVVILVGGTATVVTRFEGYVPLGEGEEFRGAVGQYLGVPRVAAYSRWPDDRFTVESIAPRTEAGVAVDLDVTLRDASGREHHLKINHPYESPGGVSYVFKDLGFAPLLVVTAADGRELLAGGFRLDVLGGRAETLTVLGKKLRVELFPDWYQEGGEDRTRGREPRNPVLRLAFEDDAGRTVQARVAVGSSVAVGPWVLHFVDWRYWVKLYVRSERGVWVLFAGFALASAALAWRLLLFRRDWVVAAGEGALLVAARADYYRSLFSEEFEATLSALRAAAGGGESAPPGTAAGERAP